MKNPLWFDHFPLTLILMTISCATYAQTLGEALDATNLTWSTSGWGAWVSQTNTTRDGVSAAEGPFVLPGQYCILETTIQGPATVTFWWKAYLSRVGCKVAGVEQASIIAPLVALDWQQSSVYLSPGPQVVQWVETYAGGSTVTTTACWLDQVSIFPGATAPIITSQPTNQCAAPGFSASLRVEAVGTPPIAYQWQLNSTNVPGANTSSLLVPNVKASDFGTYRMILTNVGGATVSSNALLAPGNVATWGRQDLGEVFVPFGAAAATAISAAGQHALALRSDGTVVAWGDNSFGETSVPVGLSNVVGLAATAYHNLALRVNGTVKTWGSDVQRLPGISVGPRVYQTVDPSEWTNIVGIAGGESFIMGLSAEGKVMVSGFYLPTESSSFWPSMPEPVDLTNAVAIAAGRNHALALRADGTVVAWGRNYELQTNTPASLSNVIAIASGDYHCLALKEDGTVVGWAFDYVGRVSPPPGLSNVTAIAAGLYHSLALKADGTVVTWGTNYYGQATAPVAASNVVAIAVGSEHNVALQGGGQRSPFLTTPLISRAAPLAGSVQFYALATGQRPLVYQWQFNGTNLPGAIGPILSKTNVKPEDGGLYAVVVTNMYGATTSLVAKLVIYDFPDALDVTNATWSVGGDAPWFVQTDVTHDGIAAVQSGAITNGGTSTFQASLIGPATLIYWWKISSETNHDFLSVKVGGLFQGSISGEANWQLQTNYIGSGSQFVEWTYSKDANGSSGQDAAWLDQFRIVPGTTAPIIVTQPKSRSQAQGFSTTFLVTAIGTPPLAYQWRLNGADLTNATSSSLLVTNVQDSYVGAYSVVVTNLVGATTSTLAQLTFGNIAGWGDNSAEQLLFPPGLTNVIAVAAGARHAAALGSNGTVVAWGANNLRQCDVPQGLSNVIAIASHLGDHTLALKADGKVVAWGDNQYSQTDVPATLSNVVAIAAGTYHSMALRSNGSVTHWGNASGIFNNKVAMAGGPDRSLFLSAAGALQAAGSFSSLPPGLTNIAAIAYGWRHGAAVRWDGTVVAWGLNGFGQANAPVGLSNVVAIAAGSNHCVALRINGTVSGWGTFLDAITNTAAIPLDGLTNVVALSAGGDFDLAVLSDRPPLAGASIFAPRWITNSFSISLPTESGHVYRMEYKSSTDGAWSALPLVSGPTGPQTLVDSTATNESRFYRIRRW